MDNQDYLEHNIDRLINSTEPRVKMPDTKKQQILSELIGNTPAETNPVKVLIAANWGKIVSSAAAVLILIMVGMYSLTGSIDGTSVAFANAMEHFASAETAQFDLTLEFGDQKPQTSSFLYDAKGYIRQNMANGTINIVNYTENKVLSLDPETMTAILRDVSKPDFNTALYDIFTKLDDLIQQAIDLSDGPVESLGKKIINDRSAYGYRVETTGQSPGLFWQGKGTLTIWADTQTDFPLILKWHNAMTNIAATVSNIGLDIYIDPTEFALDLPNGYSFPLPEPEPEEPVEIPEPQGLQAEQEDNIEPDEISKPEPQQQNNYEIPGPKIADLTENLNENDQTLIKFFHSWTFLTKGNFPSSLSTDAVKDIDPDAKITVEQKLWSYSITANFPNLMDVKTLPLPDPNTLTEEEIEQIKQKKGLIYEEMQANFSEKFGYMLPHFENIVEGLKLVNKLPAKSDWHYNGQEAILGDTDTAIFWYKPKDSKAYRVIYGDLTIDDVLPEDISLLEEASDDEIDRQANAVLETAIQLGANIPKDDRNTVFRMLSLKEKDLIKGLATYLEYSDGKYPSTLGMKKDFIIELDTTLSEAFNKGLVDKKIGKEKTLDIGFAAFFYDKLVREKKDPAYYGAAATLSDSNAVLVRWKLSKNKYRVIYTSLKAETVTTERLAELESQLPR